MENSRTYMEDQYGHGDYAQLDAWSGHMSYKNCPVDNSSLVYTSDYGSYSSQESNHSGTTYSILADCEEALHSPRSVAYDLPPPQLPRGMEKRRDKPLPPPRMTSRVPSPGQTRLLEPVKEKKISFDDSTLTKSQERADDSVPSFATLPRKKKLANTSSSETKHSAPQVTWMKEVAQKGEILNKAKSVSAAAKKKPHGILKNKLEDQPKKGDTTGYIKRNTVQKILEQQRSAQTRQSTAGGYTQCYKSLPSLQQADVPTLQQRKAWEHNYNGFGATTAQVIGVFEPSQGVALQHQHNKQNSAETEFEFPPPPSDQDISQFMTRAKSPAATENSKNEFTPLQMACERGPVLQMPQPSVERHKKPKVQTVKPPVPARTRKTTINNNEPKCHPQLSEKTTPPKVPNKHIHAMPEHPIISNDIVLPPPPEFQEGPSPLATDQPSYGDYELLSPDCSFNGATIQPPTGRHAPPKSYGGAQTQYHQRIAVDQLRVGVHDKLNVSSKSTARTVYPPSHANGSVQNNISHSNYSNKHTGYISHHHQYSTEL